MQIEISVPYEVHIQGETEMDTDIKQSISC